MTVRELLIGIGFTVDNSQVKKADAAVNSLKSSAMAIGSIMAGVGAAIGIAMGLSEIKQMADEWTSVEARVSLTTKSAVEQKKVLDELYSISQRTRQEYKGSADLYSKVAMNADELKMTQTDVLGLTENVNKALALSGGSTATRQAAILQLGQALAAGALQGDEFRSIMENAPRLSRAMANGLGVSIGELRKMSREGELTADVIIKAIMSQTKTLNNEFEKMPITMEQAVTLGMNIIGKLISDIGKETGVFKTVAKSIIGFFEGMDKVIRGASEAVGGFNNAFKILALTLASFGAAIFLVKNGITSIELFVLWLKILRLGFIQTAAAAWKFIMNPLFWQGMLIAAAIMLIVLAIEDLYYWFTGGESMIGRWLGPWEQWKTKAIQWLNEVATAIVTFFSPLYEFYKTLFAGIGQHLLLLVQLFKQVISGDFAGAFDTLGKMWDNMKTTASSAFDSIRKYAKNVLDFLYPIAQIIAKMMGLNLGDIKLNASTNVGLAGAGAGANGGINVTVNQTLPPGTSAQQAAFVDDATQKAAGESFDSLTLAMAYGG